ncbi:hypothetical protein HK097_008901 [Rhizophlyctis rosea]|uniref:RRM domain-containing protein n=1 Tax=Rhizophlyctis rosea TaxID=64517 RepID=A0AAD5X0T8_9FUNG|nr:hypothetical protein HK097_008901 [Rhizophlyctis rosea]
MREGSYSLTGRPAAGPISGAQKRIRDDDSDSDDDAGPPRKRNEGEGDEEMEDAEAPSDANANPPNRILFVRNFPADAEAALGPLFQQYPGFQEVRTVPGKPGMAFVEYETDGLAERAKTGLDGFKLSDTSPLIVEFAKK